MSTDTLDHDVVAVISRSSWFQGLPQDAYKQLADGSRVRCYEKNSHLYTNGEYRNDLFCILSGRVRLLLSSEIGQEYAVNDIEPETWLGEQFLSGDSPTMLNAQVTEQTTALILSRKAVLKVADKHPQIYKMLFETTMQRTRGVFTLLQGMAFYPLRARLAGWLLNIIKEHGEPSTEGIYFDVNLSQNDLALLCLGSRQRINKILSEWREQEILELDGSRYLIRDIEALNKELQLQDIGD